MQNKVQNDKHKIYHSTVNKHHSSGLKLTQSTMCFKFGIFVYAELFSAYSVAMQNKSMASKYYYETVFSMLLYM